MSTLMRAALACLGGEAFLTNDLSRRFRYGVAASRAARDVDGWRLLNSVLSNCGLAAGELRIISRGAEIDPRHYRVPARSRGARDQLDPELMERLRDAGGTVVVNGIDQLDERVRCAREVLEYVVDERCWANLYATWGPETGLGLHADDHDTVIIQSAGEKHWEVAGGFAETIKAGHVLHIPRDWAHRVSATGGLSVHVTFGFHRTRWSDVVAAAGTALALDGIPEHVGLRPNALAEADLSIDSYRRKRSMRHDRREGLSLPWSVGADLGTAGWVRWASRFRPIVTHGTEGCRVDTMGRSYTFDAALGDLVCMLTAGDRLRLAGLPAQASVSQPELREVLAFLLSNGLVILD
jgi:hypothetical protein